MTREEAIVYLQGVYARMLSHEQAVYDLIKIKGDDETMVDFNCHSQHMLNHAGWAIDTLKSTAGYPDLKTLRDGMDMLLSHTSHTGSMDAARPTDKDIIEALKRRSS